MKNLKLLTLLTFALLLTACSNDDDNNFSPNLTLPEVINEEEVITTMTVTLVPVGGGTTVELKTQDLDGDGPNDPVVTVTGGDLVTGATYNGTIELLNETEDPAEDITEEVEEESNEHQFFYTANGGLDVTTTYDNFDGNGNNLGTEFTLEANSTSNGTLTFTLRHEPTKPNTGLNDAGGETDIEATFNVSISL